MQRILIIDDDELSREILVLLFASEGYEVESVESGEDALAATAASEVVLTDMQMPGLSGNQLAKKLRAHYGKDVRLIAMSGSAVPAGERGLYDGFLLKPFTVADFEALLSNRLVAAEAVETTVLDPMTYSHLLTAMTHKQLGEMFDFCIADASKRLLRMAAAVLTEDDAVYRREAHTLKGSYGMLGALELKQMASAMETGGIAGDRMETGTRRDQFLDATARLQRILVSQAGH